MTPLRTILLAVDPRLPIVPRIRYCAELACVTNSELGVLHVIEEGCYDYWRGVESVQEQVDASPIDPYRTWSAVVSGDPVKLIPAFAATVQAGLVVLTARRRRAFARALLGSTSSALAQGTLCPVLMCCEAALGRQEAFACRRIVCVVTFNKATGSYISYIGSLAKLLGATVTFVYILPDMHEGRLGAAVYGEDDLVVRAEDARDRLALLAHEIAVPYDVLVSNGDPAQTVLEQLAAVPGSIVATSNSRNGCHELVEEFAGTVEAPVLTVPYEYSQSTPKARKPPIDMNSLPEADTERRIHQIALKR